MSHEQGRHPTVEELRRYSLFECDLEEGERIAAHLGGCQECGIVLLVLATEGRQGGPPNEQAE